MNIWDQVREGVTESNIQYIEFHLLILWLASFYVIKIVTEYHSRMQSKVKTGVETKSESSFKNSFPLKILKFELILSQFLLFLFLVMYFLKFTILDKRNELFFPFLFLFYAFSLHITYKKRKDDFNKKIQQ